MKLKELLSKVENVGYVLKEENGNEIEFDKLTQAEENKLMEQNVISFDVVKEDLEITIAMPKPKEKQTFTPKFNLGQEVYYFDGNKIKTTKIDTIKFSSIGTQYGVECYSYLVSQVDLFETKEELLQYFDKLIKNAVDKLEDIK
jgi:hypothetical protein